MDPTRLTAIRVGRDLARTYTEAEERTLAANLYSLIRGVYQGRFTDRPFSINLLCEINAELFNGVRDHAGRIRSRDFGSETLTFGPNRSTHRDSVPHELDEVFRSATPLLSKLEKNRSAEDYDSKTIQLAVWIHARIIQIHPFEDGNGRTSRVLYRTHCSFAWGSVLYSLKPRRKSIVKCLIITTAPGESSRL